MKTQKDAKEVVASPTEAGPVEGAPKTSKKATKQPEAFVRKREDRGKGSSAVHKAVAVDNGYSADRCGGGDPKDPGKKSKDQASKTASVQGSQSPGHKHSSGHKQSSGRKQSSGHKQSSGYKHSSPSTQSSHSNTTAPPPYEDEDTLSHAGRSRSPTRSPSVARLHQSHRSSVRGGRSLPLELSVAGMQMNEGYPSQPQSNGPEPSGDEEGDRDYKASLSDEEFRDSALGHSIQD